MPIISGGSSGGASSVGSDLWITDSNAPVFASAASFTAGSVDLTGVYTKGTRIKLTQSAAVKYFTVLSSSFGAGTTTVNITGGSDYTLANAAIVTPFYSYAANPAGWPTWFNLTLGNVVGFSVITNQLGFFATFGAMVYLSYVVSGTSNATNLTFTTPFTASNNAFYTATFLNIPVVNTDNGVSLTAPGKIQVTPNSTTLTVVKDLAAGAWTNAGAKASQGTIGFSYA